MHNERVRLVHAKDTRYTLNGYGALAGLQRFSYNFAANEEHHDEIGNPTHAATSTRPETSLSFELTDTGALAALLARIHYDYTAQDYTAGVGADVDTNEFDFNQEDLEDLIFTAGEYKAPGGVFSESKLFPFHFVTSIGINLTAEAVGSVTIDASGSLFKPIYKPYHTTRAYAAQRATNSTVTLDAGWSVGSGTHGILAVEINNLILTEGFSWTAIRTVTLAEATVSDEDRIMVWLYELTPGQLPALDYVNDIRFVNADRINLWLIPADANHEEEDHYLRVQAVDFNIDLSREDLSEIAKNERRSSVFYRATQFPLNITGSMSVLETTLHKWAELQDKELNETATTGTVDYSNVLSSNDFLGSQVVIEWYRYGADDPIQRVTLDNVQITGYDGTQEVGSRKQFTWNFTTSEIKIEGFDVE